MRRSRASGAADRGASLGGLSRSDGARGVARTGAGRPGATPRPARRLRAHEGRPQTEQAPGPQGTAGHAFALPVTAAISLTSLAVISAKRVLGLGPSAGRRLWGVWGGGGGGLEAAEP